MKKFAAYLSILFVICFSNQISAGFWAVAPFIKTLEELSGRTVAVVASHKGPVTLADIQTDYNGNTPTHEKVHVLIVPGHEPGNGGAEFHAPSGKLFERDLTVELGEDLEQFLNGNGSFKVDITRNEQNWNPVFADYFKNNWNTITSWVNTSKNGPSGVTRLGLPVTEIHNSAPTDVALRLFGIIKWSNENGVDLMIHIHFNDYPGHPLNAPGKYSGIVIYVPVEQYANGTTTHAIAQAVYKRLTLYNPVSNLKVESKGFIDDPELIALGADNTSDAASMLVEYEYLYQPQFVNSAVRSLALKDLAYQTYLGLEDYFNKNDSTSKQNNYSPSLLYTWNGPGTNVSSDPKDIYALQTALIMDGYYPPEGENGNDCPHSGTFGPCTLSALSAFQSKNGISGENGVAGPKTFSILDAIYSQAIP